MKIPLLLIWLFCAVAIAAAAPDVALFVEEPGGVSRIGWPVTSGVPFAPGALPDAKGMTLVAGDGPAVPLQTDVLARWPDGSVRWLLVDFQVDLAVGQQKVFKLRHASNASAPPIPAPVRVSTQGSRTTIETGPLRVELSRDGFDPLGAVWLDQNRDGRFTGEERVTGTGGGLFVRDANSKRHEAAQAPAEIVIEESGPLRACVRVSGRHTSANGAMFRYVFRLHAFRGQSFVRCFYTFINDHQDAVMTSIEELGVTVRLAPEAGPAAGGALGGHPRGAGRIFQVDESHYELDGQAGGARARGWAAGAGAKAGFAVGLREFWQQWPKSIETRDGAVTLGFCPDFPPGLYDGKPLAEENKLYYALRKGVHTFKVGVGKTHEFSANFFAGQPQLEQLAQFFQAAEEPLLATCEPGYVSSTGATGDFPAANPGKFGGYDAWFDRALAAHLQRRDEIREYGMLNYGDWFGERQVNWGNLEYDLAHGMFIQYLRTGDRRFFQRGAQAARHHIDVDVVHATNPHLKNPFGLPPKVGEIWLHSLNHTGGYYANAPLPVELTYQMGHSANYGHVWISGDLDYYYLTGDRRARDVALLTADMMASAMTAKLGTHIRTLGWPTILVLAAYEATGDTKYLRAATQNWQVLKQSLDPQRGWVVKLASDHCLHPAGSTRQERETKFRDQRCEGNVPFMEGLTLCALARYHRHTGDPEVLKAITVGIDQMIRECWQEDVKTFRYTACPLSAKTPYALFMLSAEAIAYEARLTGNREHQRILREGFRAAIPKGSGESFGKGLAQMTFFAPHALNMIE
ncbi:MAG: hypothetical protein HY736_11050 [Verrucomicrobia bacterium]|nr:hypothetical protein [Verrucomicrobiota bacterium]